ncbi:MAG: hypothetical protein AAGH89_10610, partial [Verrucomicrobiota bacterium]
GRELEKHGHELEHIVGPEMGHKYDDASAKQIFDALMAVPSRNYRPRSKVLLQTQTLRYPENRQISITGLKEHWQDSTVDLRRENDVTLVATKNVTSLKLPGTGSFKIDGQNLTNHQSIGHWFECRQVDGTWQLGSPEGLRKKPGLQGPIDDAFMAPFLVVLPTEPSQNPSLQKWLEFESSHFANRWRELMRGHLPVKRADELTKEDVANHSLVCWGEPTTNSVIGATIDKLPLIWDEKLKIGKTSVDPSFHVPVLIYPNPLNPERYLVINSGLSFREDHDRTNSLQNPKLPDWAVIDIRQAPDGSTPGKIVEADFFNERWAVKD